MSKASNATSAELIKRSDELRQQAEALKKKEAPEVLARIKAAIAHYGFTAGDLGVADARPGAQRVAGPGKAATKRARPGKAARPTVIRYRDDAGNSWSGFGPKPKWFKAALASGVAVETLKV